MLLPMLQQKILDKKNRDKCLYVPGIFPLYMNFNSETKKYYFSPEIDETSQDVIAIPNLEQFNSLKMTDLQFSDSSDIHVYTSDYGISLAFRNLYDDKKPSHRILKQTYNDRLVQLHLTANFNVNSSIWKKIATNWKSW